ncbi:MAG: hypothetical protein CSA81_05840 [Acidobacteria bacterium]|nr:MAG: hypothetical protein CSA81_05840 [Acidobacteriota bacterium]
MAIEGSLTSVDIQDVVQLLNINKSTGSLLIDNKETKGIVFFSNGEICDAQVHSLSGLGAAYVLLGQSSGLFRFHNENHNRSRVIHKTIHDLVLEAARRKDTIQNIRTRISHNNIIYLPLVDVRIPSIAKKYSPLEKKMFSLLDGVSDIQQMIDKVGEGEFETLHTIYELEQRGDLKRVNIYKLLEVHPRKSLFKSPKEVVISEKIMDDWDRESALYSGVDIVEIHTQKLLYGQVKSIVKEQIPDNHILIPKGIMQQFQISENDRVLVKPIPLSAY